MTVKKSYLSGHWSHVKEGSPVLVVRDKYSQGVLGQVAMADADEVDKAVEFSANLFKKSREISSEIKSNWLDEIHGLLLEDKDAMAKLICQEAGKPLSYAYSEVERCLTTLKLARDEALRFVGDVVPVDYGSGTGKRGMTAYFPCGVIAAFSPFNFPLNLAIHKIAPALAIGAPIIIKPSPFAPLSLLRLAELFDKSSIPRGMVNVLVCENDVAQLLITDERVKVFSFTGSPQVGWALKEKAGKKKVILELGGNAGVIVDEGVKLVEVVKRLSMGPFLYAGQICISTQRIYVHQNCFEEFVRLFVDECKKLKVGNPMDENTIVGPLIDRMNLERIEKWVEEALREGAKIHLGGQVVDRQHNIYGPTILSQTRSKMKVSAEEIFGPVVCIEKISSFEEGIEKINDSRFGLQAAVFTNHIDMIKMAFNHLEVGAVVVNNIPGLRVDGMPYGGVKDSGQGREGVAYSMREMSELKMLIF